MDLGEPFKHGMQIEPAEDGSYFVYAGPNLSRKFGFTTIDDLLIWMAKHGAKARVTELSDGDVMPGIGGGQALKAALVRRTTAAEIIAEREARAKFYTPDAPTNAA